MTKKKSSTLRRNAVHNRRTEHARPKWMRILGFITVIVFTMLVLLLVVMSVARYYHIFSHH